MFSNHIFVATIIVSTHPMPRRKENQHEHTDYTANLQHNLEH
jgi:hypothetical protein